MVAPGRPRRVQEPTGLAARERAGRPRVFSRSSAPKESRRAKAVADRDSYWPEPIARFSGEIGLGEDFPPARRRRGPTKSPRLRGAPSTTSFEVPSRFFTSPEQAPRLNAIP